MSALRRILAFVSSRPVWLFGLVCAAAAVLVLSGLVTRSAPSSAPLVAADHGLLGVNLEVPEDAAALSAMLEAAQRLGARWLRFHLRWDLIEERVGEYDWSRWDHFVAEAVSRGFSLLAVLDATPAWALSPEDHGRAGAPPSDFGAFAEFAREAAERYRGRMAAFQVWDQPNLGTHWTSDGPNPADYAALLSSGFRAIKQVSGAVRVIAGGLAPTTEVSPRNISDLAFLDGMYRAGAQPYFDALGFKPYGMWSDAATPPESSQTNFRRTELLRDVMVRNGDTAKPIWAVEFGWNTLPEWWSGRPSPWGTDAEGRQAHRAQAAVALAREQWPWIGPLMWSRLAPPVDASDPAYGFALLDRQGQERRLFEALRDVAYGPETGGPGWQPATRDAARWSGGWRFSPLGADISATGDSAVISFKGTGLSLRLRRGDYWAILYVDVDGAPAPALPRDEQGRAYVVLYDPERAMSDVTVAAGLADGDHQVSITAEGGWGQWAIAGWTVTRGVAVRHSPAVAVAAATALAALGAAVGLRRRWAPPLLMWLARAERRPLVLFCGLAAAALLLALGRTPGLLTGWLTITVMAAIRLEYGLGALAASLPLYPLRLPIAGREASVTLIVLAGCLAGWAARWVVERMAGSAVKRSPGEQCGGLGGDDLGVAALAVVGVGSLAVSQRLGVSVRELLQVLLAACAAYAMVRSLPTRASVWPIADGLVLGGAAVAALGVVQFITGHQVISAEGVLRVRALYGSPNNLALYLGRVLPLAFAVAAFGRGRRWLYGAAAVMQFAACLLTFSRGAWLLGLPAAFLFIGIVRGGRTLWALLAGTVVTLAAAVPFSGAQRFAGLFQTSQGTTFLRLSLWRSAWNMIRDHPLAGVGLDNFLSLYRTRYVLPGAWEERDLSHPHNLILDWWTRLGVLGLLVGAWLVGAFAARAMGVYHRSRDPATQSLALGLCAGLVYSLAHGLIDHSFFLTDLATAFMLGLGMVAVLSRRLPAESPTPPTVGEPQADES